VSWSWSSRTFDYVFLVTDLRIIETNLDSVSRTPRLQRQEMLQYVHRPILLRLDYRPLDIHERIHGGCALDRLILINQIMVTHNDLHVLTLKTGIGSPRKLDKVPLRGKALCREQLKKFCDKAQHIYVELGQWAADYFILESITRLKRAVEADFGWADDEKAYLLQELNPLSQTRLLTDFTASECPRVSPKLERLISFLIVEDRPYFSGLIFVRQRATVSVLSELLSIHPKTKDRFRCAPYVGLSNTTSRKQSIGELLDIRGQRETLTEFRDGGKNLIIATDVLEEGIDVTACHLVICFDNPPNMKSFVQRRGRARQKKSTFAIMVPEGNTSISFDNWQKLEEEMIRAYQDDTRRLQEVSLLENIQEDVTDTLRIKSTG
jgi:Lhr-like helicase